MATEVVEDGVLKSVVLDEGETSYATSPAVRIVGARAIGADFAAGTVTLSDECEEVRDFAFFNNGHIRTLNIGRGLRTISSHSFAYRNALEKIEVSADNDTFSSVNGCLCDKAGEIVHLGVNAEVMELPATCRAVDENAFAYCGGIRTLRLNSALVSIGAYAFCDCSGIENVYVSANVVEIGKGAFCGCGRVDTITVDGSRNAGGTNIVDLLKVAFADIGKVSQVKITGRVGKIALLLGDGTFANTDIDTLVDTGSRPADEWPYAKNYRNEDQTITATFRCIDPTDPSKVTDKTATVSPGMPFGTLPLPVSYEGFAFQGWFYEDKESFGDEEIKRDSIVRPIEPFVVEAKYAIKTFTVVFYSYDGTTIVKEYGVNYGEKVETPSAPEYDTTAYDFKGWVDRESPSIVYGPGVETSPITSNLVFDAQLTPKGIFDFEIVATETSTAVSILGFNPYKEDEDIKSALLDSATGTYNLRIPDTMEVQVDGKPKTLKVRTVGYDLYDEDGNPISAEGQTKPDGKPLKPFGYFKHSVIFNDVSLGTNVAKVNAFAFDGFRCRHLILPYSLVRIGNCAFRCENSSDSSLLNSCEVRMENRIVDGDYKDNYNAGLCPVGENFLKVGEEAFAYLNAGRPSELDYEIGRAYSKGTILHYESWYSEELGQNHYTWRVTENISAAENVGFYYLHVSGKVEEYAWIYIKPAASQISLGAMAFYKAQLDLLSWKVPTSVTSVPRGCFGENYYLRCISAITYPIRASKVGEYAFGSCSNLVEYPVSGAITIGKHAFYECSRMNDISLLTDENGAVLTSIGDRAFSYLGTSVSIMPLSTTRLDGCTIGNEAFLGSGFTRISITAAVIKSYAFAYSDRMGEVRLENPSTEAYIVIGSYAFYVNPMRTLVLGKCSSIGAYAFYNCHNVQNLTIDTEASPAEIGAYAFYNFGQREVVEDGTVVTPALEGWVIDNDFLGDTLVGNHAFDMSRLEGLDSAVRQIGDYAFANSALKSATIRQCGIIAGNAFRNCKDLTEFSATDTSEFGSGVCRDDPALETAVITSATYIGANAFYNATSLLSIVLNTSNLTHIGENAFKAEKGKTMQSSIFWNPVTNVFGIDFQRDNGSGYESSGYSWLVHTGTTKAVINLDTVSHTIDGNEWAAANGSHYIAGIASKTFRGSEIGGITHVYLPNYGTSVKKEGSTERLLPRLSQDAFSGFTSLTIYMPSPCSIADYAFDVQNLTIYTKQSVIEECKFDTSITNMCTGDVQLVDIDTGIGFGLNLVLYVSLYSQEYSGSSLVETVRITNNCSLIASSAFSGCGRLRSVTFDGRSNELDIGSSAFQGCTSISELAVPANIRIAGSAFADCTGIASVSFLAGTERSTKIGGYAFANCQSLMSVSVSSSVDTIEAGLFYNCPNLHMLHTDSIATYVQIAQRSRSGGNPFYYSSCTRLFVGGVETSSISVSGSLGHIPGWTFRNFTCLRTVALGEGISSIGVSAFEGCENMENISLPASLVTLPQAYTIFSGCNSLTTIAVAADNPNFSSVNGMLVGKTDNVLYCGRNGNVPIPEGIVDIKDYAFYGLGGLTAVSFPSTLRNIGDNAFGGCYGLTALEIPSSISTFGRACFTECSNLSSVTLENGIERLSEFMFGYCTSLSTVVVPDSVTEIQSSAFLGSGLASITIGENVRTLGTGVFQGCSHLALVQMRGDCPTVGARAFQGISSSCVVRIPEGNTTYNVVGGKWQGMTVEYY